MKDTFINRRAGLLAAFALTILFALPAHAQFGINRLLNGDAEASAGSTSGNSNGAPANWTVTAGNFTAVTYTAFGEPIPTADQGLNYFAGGESNAFASGSQNISVSDVSLLIDAGKVGFNASGFFGGFSGQNDNAVLRLTFLNSTNAAISAVTVGGVTAADRGGITSLLFRQLTGSVPVGTRTITASLEMTRTDGSYNDGYADNLAVKLTNKSVTVPEAGAMPLLALGGLLTIGMIRRRRPQPA